MAKTVADPSTPPDLKRKLELVLAAREFAFTALSLKRSDAYTTWTPVKGPALTWLVSASRRTRLEPYEFSFPLIGSFPYKGHFRRDLAESEAASLEKKGWDATVSGASAYKTPLPVSDPLPTTVLDYRDGDLVETLIHELTHGTVYFRSRTDFDEAVATWAGARGAEAFFAARGAEGAAALKDWREGRSAAEKRDALYGELKARLEALYGGPGTDAEKLDKRAAEFDWARAQAKARGLAPLKEPLNNAVVLAHALYSPDLAPFDALFEKNGRDWKKTVAALKGLDRRDPFGALRAAAR